MNTELSFEQTRVIGVLIEKEATTPDQYPMSINGITTACNQKSNRDPVVEFTEVQVQNIVDELIELKLLNEINEAGARVIKYRHRFFGSQFSAFNFSTAEAAILAVLFLRGPQTPGELRTRTQRIHAFSNVQEAEQALHKLATREDGPYLIQLAREAGKRESRYAHLFSGEVESTPTIAASSTSPTSTSNEQDERIAVLEQEVAQLKAELASIKEALDL